LRSSFNDKKISDCSWNAKKEEKILADDSSAGVGQIDPTRGILPQIFPAPSWRAIYNFLLIKAY
jgi:hypothetical protein